MAEIDLLKNSSFVTANENLLKKLDTQNALLATIASNNGGMSVTSWEDMRNIVRRGLASSTFNIGDLMTCQKSGKTLIWGVMGLDHAIPANSTVKHTLTLQLLYADYNTPYDWNEALYYAEEQLAAGTYNVVLDDGFFTAGAGAYQFTLTSPVPQGGQVYLSWNTNKNIASSKIITYASATSFTPIETVDIVAGANGTNLSPLNDFECVRYGRNNYVKSNIRQFLNSDKPKNEWFAATHIYDRCNSNAFSGSDGFLYGVDEDFKNVLYPLPKKIKLNDGTEETLNDLIYLPTKAEIYGDMTNEVEGEEAFDYYAMVSHLTTKGNGADAGRIKYTAQGNAALEGLLTSLTNKYQSYSLRNNGAILPLAANNYMYYSPICTIA